MTKIIEAEYQVQTTQFWEPKHMRIGPQTRRVRRVMSKRTQLLDQMGAVACEVAQGRSCVRVRADRRRSW